jgi:addiction module RelE/StbE family toxin
MRTIAIASSFKRAYKILLRKRPDLKPKVIEILRLLCTTPFTPSLQTHKLKGDLAGSWSCTVEYDCRIVFNFIEGEKGEDDNILLIDIGSHYDVY